MQLRFGEYRPSEILRGHLRMGGCGSNGERIDVNSLYIERGGKPWIGVMGEYHFVRDSRESWRCELAKMKAGGVTIVATYMFWIYHEELEGQFDFSGSRDVRTFVMEAQAQGMDVLLRIGPWAHGECRNGGFPDWLMQKGIPLRTNDPRYMALVRAWYEQIFRQVEGLFYKDGGPIVGVQFENELVDNSEHLLALKQLALEIGYEAPIYTVTGWNSKYGARIPVDEVMPVFGAYVEAPWASHLEPQPLSPHFAFDPVRNDAAVGVDVINDCAPDGWRLPYERYPFATCELGAGLQPTHHRRIVVSPMDAYVLSLVKLGCGNNLIGYYMYHGGTNAIGRYSTLQESRATGYPNDYTILNYDFHTCLSQYGEARGQYGLLNMLHLFAADFGDRLAPMESVPAERFVPCTDMQNLRACLRTDGRSGFVFINHYQRRAKIADVHGVQLTALGVDFPAIDVTGDTAFFLPVNMELGGVKLRWATSQPLCREGDTYFFAKADGVDALYQLEEEDGSRKTVTAQAGLNSGFVTGGVRIVTLTWAQAQHLRRLGGMICVGEGCNLYLLDGEVQAIEDGAFAWRRWTGDGFERMSLCRPFQQAELTLTAADEPFVPPYEEELTLGGPRRRWWQRMQVSSPDGFVCIGGEYDAAQIYGADGCLLADNFFCGEEWRVPAALLYGRECFLVMSEWRDDCYLEKRHM